MPPKHTTLDNSRGETWRHLRKNLSPTFTSGKLKGMLDPMDKVADDTLEFIEEQRQKNSIIDLKPILQGKDLLLLNDLIIIKSQFLQNFELLDNLVLNN